MSPWYHQQESNLYLALRRHSFYPLNYGGTAAIVVCGTARHGVVKASIQTRHNMAC